MRPSRQPCLRWATRKATGKKMTPELRAEPATASSKSLDGTGRGLGKADAGPRCRHRRRGSRTAYAYIGAAFAYLVVFVLYPIGKAIWISLTSTNLLSPTKNEYVGLANYQSLLDGGLLQHTLLLTVVFVVAVAVLSIVLGVGAALLVETLVSGKTTVR